jgi:hypothetical protein
MEEKNLIEITLTYQGKSVLVETNPYKTIGYFMEEVKHQARENSDKMFNMPEMNTGDLPVHYFLTRTKGKKTEILKPRNRKGDNQTLDDYGVVSGDELIIESEPTPGANLM